MASTEDLKVASEEIIRLARSQLLPAFSQLDMPVPSAYLNELKWHLLLYPYDSKFRVTLTPNRGYGIVTCLENQCGLFECLLGPNPSLRDGGKALGFGSFNVYRSHIANHPTHARARHARVKSEMAQHDVTSSQSGMDSAPATVRERDLLGELDASFASSVSHGSVDFQRQVKREPSDTIPTRKRPFLGPPFTEEEELTPNMFPAPLATTKKPKLEPPKTPLTAADMNRVPSQPTGYAEEDVTLKLNSYRNLLQRLRQQATPTKTNTLNIEMCAREISRLEKEEEGSVVPAPSPLNRNRNDKNFRLAFDWSPQKVKPATSTRGVSAAQHRPIEYDGDIESFAGPSKSANDDSSSSHDGLFKDDPFYDFRAAPFSADEACTPGIGMGAPLDDLSFDLLPNIPPPPHMLPSTMVTNRDHVYDDQGNFYGRGRDTFVGPQARPDDINKFLIIAGNASQFDGNASVDEALKKLGLTAQRQLLPGMEVALMPHQTIGVAWMLEKEQNKAFNGGCLSDEMGLGKTVQMIALMVTNVSDNPMCKTNLILAPMALLDQWKLEIELKTNNGFKCHIYHGTSKLKKKNDILKYDVILTTYQTMALEWPDLEAEEKAKVRRRKKSDQFTVSDSEDDMKARGKKQKAHGLLFEVDWYRIVLDESQNIRNRKTRCSRAVTELKSTYRWCLTGTPIINALSDTYSLLRYLKIRPWYDWQEFHQHISKIERSNPQLAVRRLQAILATCNFRRMKNSQLNGKNLIQLPNKSVELLKLSFSPEEREIYNMVETRSQEKFNRFRRAGTVLKNYHHVLVMLLRLRQICSHASLIQEEGAYFVPANELHQSPTDAFAELTRARELVSPEFVDKMRDQFKEAALTRRVIASEAESAGAPGSTADVEGDECPICFDIFTDAVVTPCTHCFCCECLVNVLNSPHAEDINDTVQYKADERPCPVCRSPISEQRVFRRSAFEPTEAELDQASAASVKDVTKDDVDSDEEFPDAATISGDAKGKSKANDSTKEKRAGRRGRRAYDPESDEDDDLSDFIVHSDEDEEEKDLRKALKQRHGRRAVLDSEDEAEDENIIYGKARMNLPPEQIKLLPKFLPSTKMKHMMESIHRWATEYPEEKILIISQWTQSLSLVSDYLTEQGVLHVKYQGDMNRKKRDQAVRVFMAKDKATVMLMSLKCGGVGLNLTRANRVISLDLGWSPAIENQAFDRVHRLGQQRDVVVRRLVIEDTVEDRILQLQERKQNLADGSLGEGKGKKMGRLTVNELANLFGLGGRF